MKTGRSATEIFVALVLVGLLPALNLLGLISDYSLNLTGKYLAFAILAMGLGLVWGYCGILSLCQAVFFGLGAYAIGMTLLLESSGQGVYGERIPDFMVWNQVEALPLFWKPFASFPFAAASAVLVPAALAALIGLLTFRRKVTGVYFAILSQAMAFAAWLMLNRNEVNLGGTNGLTGFKTILGFSLNDPRTMRVLYLVTAATVAALFILGRRLLRSKLGLVLTAVRDDERRLEFLGYPVASYKLFVFSLGAALAGLAGALYVPQVGIITPNQVGVVPSLEVVVWVAVGGRASLMGPVLGAIGVNAARSFLTAQAPEWWPIVLGCLFIAVVLFVPKGLVGLPSFLLGLWRAVARRIVAASRSRRWRALSPLARTD